MAYTTINKSTDYFNTKLWTGNGSTQNITGVNHTPDFVWIKKRTDADGARIFDTIRGATKAIFTNSTSAETTVTSELSAFDSDGYTLGASDAVNGNTKQYVGWNWKANGTGSANTDGSINSTVSVNTTAGFSIVSYTGTGANATVGHGLGVAPSMIITKSTGAVTGWGVYHQSLGNTDALFLNETTATGASSVYWNNTSPTSSVFSVGSASAMNNTNGMIAYCFAEKTGYSKFGSYTGNGSASSGPFIYTGFKPAFVMIKKTDNTGSWEMFDAKREGFNPQVHGLYANLNNAEDNTDDLLDLLSNGFKLYHDGGGLNTSGGTYIYMAFAEAPLVGSNNIPATAR